MGWLFTQGQTRQELVTRLTQSWVNENGTTFTCLRHTCTGNNLWTVWEVAKEDLTYRFIGLDMMKPQAGYGWGYKDLDERMGLRYYNCPEAYLDMVTDPGGYATEWRAQVHAYWAERRRQAALAAELQPGMLVSLVGATVKTALITRKEGKTLWGRAENYVTYRIPVNMLGERLSTANVV